MLISTLNCEMWPNFSYRGVRSVQLLLLLLLLMVFSSENFGFSPPYAGIAGIGPASSAHLTELSQLDILLGMDFDSVNAFFTRRASFSWETLCQNLMVRMIAKRAVGIIPSSP